MLVDDDLVLWESTAIMRYLTARCGGDLVPATARAQAELDRWPGLASRTSDFSRADREAAGLELS